MNEDRWRNIVLYFEMSVNVGVSHIWEENQIYQMPHIPGTNLTEKFFFVKYGLKDEYTHLGTHLNVVMIRQTPHLRQNFCSLFLFVFCFVSH